MTRLVKNYLTFEEGSSSDKRKKMAQAAHLAGKKGEKLIARFLAAKGYHLLSQNYRIPGGEIDLIMGKDGIIVFVEVKLRTSESFGTGEDSVTWLKKRALIRAARTYMASKADYSPWRIDLVTLAFSDPRRACVRHYQDIFAE